MIHVAVAAPAQALRAGLFALLNGDGVQVVAEAASIDELQPLAADIDVLVLAGRADRLPEINTGLPVDPPVALLFLVSGGEAALPVMTDLAVRAWGVLPLEASAEELLAAVGALAQGLIVISPRLADDALRLLGTGRPVLPILAGPINGELTEREAQVLGLLAQGLANKQIALRLGISEHTVKFHVSAIFTKLGANSRTEAVRLGVRQGLVSL